MKKAATIIILAIIFILPSYALAGTYYVTQSGAGSKDGSNWNNAYAGLPSSLSRGSTYYIADGSYGSRTFDTAASGNQVITLKKATASDHGTSTGWSGSMGDGQATFGSYVGVETDDWLFDGQTRNSDWTSGYGFKVQATSSGAKTVRFNTTTDNVTFRYFDIAHRGSGYDEASDCVYSIYKQTNLTFQYCYIHDCSRDHFVLTNFDGLTIHDCYIARNWSTSSNHGQCFHFIQGNNCDIHGNKIVDIVGTGVLVPMDGEGKTFNNTKFYNNVVWKTNTGSNFATGFVRIINDVSVNGMYIHHNTIVDFDGWYSVYENTSGTTQNIYAYNNLWDGCGRDGSFNGGGSGVNLNYSSYYNCSGHTNEANDVEGNGNIFVNRSGEDFHLTAHTVAGTSVGSPYNVDKDGVPRVNPDRGAFEYNDGNIDSSEVPPSPPTNLKIIQQ